MAVFPDNKPGNVNQAHRPQMSKQGTDNHHCSPSPSWPIAQQFRGKCAYISPNAPSLMPIKTRTSALKGSVTMPTSLWGGPTETSFQKLLQGQRF